MAKMGRPKKEINFEELDKLCHIQCTQEEIAWWFECHVETIEARIKDYYDMTFSEYYKMKSAGGKISLRRKQFQVAMNGNCGMLVWLGKQYLNQRDNKEPDPEDEISYPSIEQDEEE